MFYCIGAVLLRISLDWSLSCVILLEKIRPAASQTIDLFFILRTFERGLLFILWNFISEVIMGFEVSLLLYAKFIPITLFPLHRRWPLTSQD